jgi:hypothetical protein
MDCVDVRYSRILLVFRCSLDEWHDPSRIPDGELPGRNISPDSSTTSHHRSFSDLNAVTDQSKAADKCSLPNDDSAGAKFPRPKLMERNFDPYANHDVVLNGQELWKRWIDPNIGGDKDVMSNMRATPPKQFHLGAIPSEFQDGQEKPSLHVETQGFQEWTITRAKTCWLRRMAAWSGESPFAGFVRQEPAEIVPGLFTARW